MFGFEEKMAEAQGFEPWIGYKPMPVFKTGAFNRSATLPFFMSACGKIRQIISVKSLLLSSPNIS